MQNIKTIISSNLWNSFIFGVIMLNAVVFGLETIPSLGKYEFLFAMIDNVCLTIFTIEIFIRFYVYRLEFFTDKVERGWNIFDLIVIGVSIFSISYIILRSFRVLRLLQVFSHFTSMRLVTSAILHTILAMFSVIIVLMVFYYVYALLCVNLFGAEFPEYFGDLGSSFFTLFQIMTFESWSESVVRPIMKLYPYAWILFVGYIFIVSFVVLNLIVAVIVNSLDEIKQKGNV
ncbi:ion transporter [Campylobacter suis]|uniref:Ion transport domain-containing protein n=1 Tax=Campylobacter suis TaxID=2790657 RepID=A0ABM8Q5N4_9BACT|nr:ion transporter [Campylobacter suis]CAD7288103.1 hypothetical protein LMG8286_01139 [Campylobacter suis]